MYETFMNNPAAAIMSNAVNIRYRISLVIILVLPRNVSPCLHDFLTCQMCKKGFLCKPVKVTLSSHLFLFSLTVQLICHQVTLRNNRWRGLRDSKNYTVARPR